MREENPVDFLSPILRVIPQGNPRLLGVPPLHRESLLSSFQPPLWHQTSMGEIAGKPGPAQGWLITDPVSAHVPAYAPATPNIYGGS